MQKREFSILSLLLIPVVIYILGLEPSLVGGDGDEYLLQAYQAGIAHPCGYPVYLWIGKIALLMTSNGLNSMNIVSLFFSAFTLVFLYFFLRKLGVNAPAAITSVLVFSFSPVFFRFAMESEVHNVNIFIVALALYLFYRWSQKHQTRILSACGLIYGLSLGVYFANILFIAPLIVFVLYECRRERIKHGRNILILLASVLIGAAAPVLYIYFRSKHLPPIGTYYNPDNLNNLLLYLSGRQYGTTYFRGWAFLLERISLYSSLFMVSLTGIFIFFAFKGMVSQLKLRKGYALLLLSIGAINFCYSCYYRVADSYMMLEPSFLVLTIFISLGLDKLYYEKISLKGVQYICLGALVAVMTMRFYPASLKIAYDLIPAKPSSDSVFSECQRVLGKLPQDSVLFCPWDKLSSFLCLQVILKQRPDIRIFEAASQPRNYKIGNQIQSFSWHEYISNNVLNPDKPIFSLITDSELERKFIVKRIDRGLFSIISPKGHESGL